MAKKSDSDQNSEENTEETNVHELDVDAPSGTSSQGGRVQELESALAKEKNDALYLRAEFDNYRKRMIKERSDLLKYAGERAFTEILGVMDNFERALATPITKENFESYKKGVEMISEELRNTLKRFGVVETAGDVKTFDPMIFEAIGSEETTDVPEGNITRVCRKAYKYHDKVIRPGQVMVARAPKKNSEGREDSSSN